MCRVGDRWVEVMQCRTRALLDHPQHHDHDQNHVWRGVVEYHPPIICTRFNLPLVHTDTVVVRERLLLEPPPVAPAAPDTYIET